MAKNTGKKKKLRSTKQTLQERRFRKYKGEWAAFLSEVRRCESNKSGSVQCVASGCFATFSTRESACAHIEQKHHTIRIHKTNYSGANLGAQQEPSAPDDLDCENHLFSNHTVEIPGDGNDELESNSTILVEDALNSNLAKVYSVFKNL